MSKLADALYLDGVDISPENIDMLIGTLDGRHGWKVVPVNATDDMQSAADNATWVEMLAASPDPLGGDDEQAG